MKIKKLTERACFRNFFALFVVGRMEGWKDGGKNESPILPFFHPSMQSVNTFLQKFETCQKIRIILKICVLRFRLNLWAKVVKIGFTFIATDPHPR